MNQRRRRGEKHTHIYRMRKADEKHRYTTNLQKEEKNNQHKIEIKQKLNPNNGYSLYDLTKLYRATNALV